MILSALNDYYQRLLEQGADGVSPFGYSQEKISYEILLSPDGEVVDVNDIRQVAGNKPIPRSLSVPQPENAPQAPNPISMGQDQLRAGCQQQRRRTHGIGACSLQELHLQALADEDDAGCSPDEIPEAMGAPKFRPPTFSEEMLDTNVVFRLDGQQQYLHESPAAQTVRAKLLASGDSRNGLCR